MSHYSTSGNSIYNTTSGNYIEPSKEFLKKVSKAIYEHKSEMDEYVLNGQKLAAVKAIKEWTGGGLKESKDAFEMYLAKLLPSFIKEDRRKKLEKLAKKPLVDELVKKIKNIDEDQLSTFLLNLSVDELLSIDEIFPNDEESDI